MKRYRLAFLAIGLFISIGVSLIIASTMVTP